ncbi:MAG: CopG family transcriptional regulator [Deltaproteobacteria bacterium]|jgi:RHH-type rel operon transcriptional repressor/antitoxin RelB|nr:CopG family transcriptional regulator [Deltaproteobacteria bacterium]
MSTTIRLSQEAESRLNFLAASTGRTKTYYLREIIEKGLDDMEDYYLASNVLEKVRKDEESVHTSKEVRKELDLGD